MKLSLVLIGRAMLSKYLIQFSLDGLGCVPFLLFNLRPNYGGGNEDNDDLLCYLPMYTLLHLVPLNLQQTPQSVSPFRKLP